MISFLGIGFGGGRGYVLSDVSVSRRCAPERFAFRKLRDSLEIQDCPSRPALGMKLRLGGVPKSLPLQGKAFGWIHLITCFQASIIKYPVGLTRNVPSAGREGELKIILFHPQLPEREAFRRAAPF